MDSETFDDFKVMDSEIFVDFKVMDSETIHFQVTNSGGSGIVEFVLWTASYGKSFDQSWSAFFFFSDFGVMDSELFSDFIDFSDFRFKHLWTARSSTSTSRTAKSSTPKSCEAGCLRVGVRERS